MDGEERERLSVDFTSRNAEERQPHHDQKEEK